MSGSKICKMYGPPFFFPGDPYISRTTVLDNYEESIALSTTFSEIVINNTTLVGIYNISVYSFKDIPSVSTHTVIRLNGIVYFLLKLVPSPVGSLFSFMYNTWANISWTVPSYIPVSYPIITYEIGYHICLRQLFIY